MVYIEMMKKSLNEFEKDVENSNIVEEQVDAENFVEEY